MRDATMQAVPNQPIPILRTWLRAVGSPVAIASLIFLFCVSVFCFAAAAAPQQDDPPQNDPPRSFRSFDFSYVVKVTPPPGSRKLEVWIPLPSTDDFQDISFLKLSGAKKICIVTDAKSGDRRAFVALDPSQSKAPVEIRVAFQATRYEYRLDGNAASDSQDTFAMNVEPYTRPDASLPVDASVVASLANAQTAGVTDPIEKAHRLYDYLVSTAHRDHDAARCERRNAVRTAESQSISPGCMEVHSLFVAMARAAGIPARLQVGFSLLGDEKRGSLAGSHVWAEFYVNGMGWIPVDASQAMREPFGTMDSNRVVFVTELSKLEMLAANASSVKDRLSPYIQVDGNPFGHYSADVFFQEDGLPNSTPSTKTIYARRVVAGVNPQS